MQDAAFTPGYKRLHAKWHAMTPEEQDAAWSRLRVLFNGRWYNRCFDESPTWRAKDRYLRRRRWQLKQRAAWRMRRLGGLQ